MVPKTLGPYSAKKHNRRSNMSTKFCIKHYLVITNTMLKNFRGRLLAWNSPEGKMKNSVDIILSSKYNSRQ